MMKIKSRKALWIIILLILVVGGVIFSMLRTRPLPGSDLDSATVPTVSIAAGGNQSLAILDDGSMWTWGNNGTGQLGDGTTEDRHSPVRIMDGILIP